MSKQQDFWQEEKLWPDVPPERQIFCNRTMNMRHIGAIGFDMEVWAYDPFMNEERARELYDEGSPDTRIAAELGCSQSAVSGWRYREGLPPIYPHKRMNEAKLRELYREGLNDTQISKVTGNSTDAIRRWRKRNGLESNWKEKKI